MPRENLNSIIICISTVRMHRWKWNLLLVRPHLSLQANSSCLNLITKKHAMATFLLCSNIKCITGLSKGMINNCRSRLSFARGSVACWAGLSKLTALCAVHMSSRMRLYGHSYLCTQHCNSDHSWAFWTCTRVHPLDLCPPGKDIDYIRKSSLWKIFSLYIVHV